MASIASSTGMMYALAATSAISAISQGITANTQAKQNAKILEQRAESARAMGELRKKQIERRKRIMLGKQRALYAKSGVKLEGSPIEVLADTASQYDLDKAIEDYNTRVEVTSNLYDAQFQRRVGKQKFIGGFTKAATSLMGAYSGSKKPGGFESWKSKGLASTPEQYGYNSEDYR